MKLNFKNLIMAWGVNNVAPLIGKLYTKTYWPYTISDLLKFPNQSLGKVTALTLLKQNYQFIPQFETHDCKHVLLNYEMNGLGECRLVFFSFGNGNKTIITFISMALALILYPQYYSTFKKDFSRGKRYVNLANINVCNLLAMPIMQAKKIIHK